VPSSNVRLVWVPGSFELPLAARRLAKAAPRPHAVIALGTLIRGETPQYDAIAHAVARGLMEVAVSTGIPVGFGVVVAETPAQARARAGGRLGHRGEEAALAVLELLRVFEHTDEHRGR
jgi:6,7-dimethyl-8-ribityllumazine synthase